jgi:hypothetical protein
MGAEATRMDDSLRNALVIEVKDLLAKVKILQQCRTAWPNLQVVLIIRNRYTLLSSERWNVAAGDLMSFAALASHDFLLANLNGLSSTARCFVHHVSLIL